MHKRIADHKRRVARLNRYVFVVALLWVVTSFALLWLSGSRHSDAAGTVTPALDHALHAIAAVTLHPGATPPVS